MKNLDFVKHVLGCDVSNGSGSNESNRILREKGEHERNNEVQSRLNLWQNEFGENALRFSLFGKKRPSSGLLFYCIFNRRVVMVHRYQIYA